MAATIHLYLDTRVVKLMDSGEISGLSASDIRRRIAFALDPVKKAAMESSNLFAGRFRSVMDLEANPGTRKAYTTTLNHLIKYDKNLESRSFEDQDRTYLRSFEAHCLRLGLLRNSVNVQLRNIRAVFNWAIDEEVTNAYPFRMLRIRPQATKGRSLTAAQLREIFSFPVPDWQKEYVDMFKLIFLLFGINVGDIVNLTTPVDAEMVEYDRKKAGKHYSIRLEPEAREIMQSHRGRKHTLSPLDRYRSHSDNMHHLNYALHKVGMEFKPGLKPTGKPPVKNLTTYYARYSWATIAAELDIPRET